MRNKLIELYDALEQSLPPHQIKGSCFLRHDSKVSKECSDLFEHLKNYRTLVVTTNQYGLECIQDTDIRVIRSVSFGPYLDTRYGKLVIPTSVQFL